MHVHVNVHMLTLPEHKKKSLLSDILYYFCRKVAWWPIILPGLPFIHNFWMYVLQIKSEWTRQVYDFLRVDKKGKKGQKRGFICWPISRGSCYLKMPSWYFNFLVIFTIMASNKYKKHCQSLEILFRVCNDTINLLCNV